jgi:hypothetical protein
VDTLNVTILGVVFTIGVAFDATLDAAATILVIFLVLKCVVRGWPATKPCPFCRSWIAVDATKCAHCQSSIVRVPEMNRAGENAHLSDIEDDIDASDQ